MSASLNPLAIIVAALANMAVGAIWYSPKVLGAKWLILIGKTREEQGGMMRPLILHGLSSLVLSYTLAVLVSAMEMNSFVEGVLFGFLLGAGIVGAAVAPMMAYEGRPRQLFTLNVGYAVVGMMVMGGILAAWQ